MSKEERVPYDYRTVRFVVFKGTEPVSQQFKKRYQARAYQAENGGQVLRVEKDTLRKMNKVPTVWVKMGEEL